MAQAENKDPDLGEDHDWTNYNEPSVADKEKTDKDKLASQPLRGACRCGACEFETVVLRDIYACYCTDCQLCSGSIVAAWMQVPLNRFKWIKNDKMTTYKTDPNKAAYRAFCSVCGGNLVMKYSGESEKDFIWFAVVLLKDKKWFKKETNEVYHIFCRKESKPTWFQAPKDGFSKSPQCSNYYWDDKRAVNFDANSKYPVNRLPPK